jgi:hypothetical protein
LILNTSGSQKPAKNGNKCERAYIAAESLHMLNPQPDDVVLMNDLEGANSLEFLWEGRNADKDIERDNIPFIWPESEEE